MKIPKNTILNVLTLGGLTLAAVSSYWIGRRDELEQIISIAKSADGGHAIAMTVYDKMNKAVPLLLGIEE